MAAPVPLHHDRYEPGAPQLRAALLRLLADPPDGTGLVLHDGALTGPGRALIGSGDLAAEFTGLLPPPADKAHFPGDLTAVVPGGTARSRSSARCAACAPTTRRC